MIGNVVLWFIVSTAVVVLLQRPVDAAAGLTKVPPKRQEEGGTAELLPGSSASLSSSLPSSSLRSTPKKVASSSSSSSSSRSSSSISTTNALNLVTSGDVFPSTVNDMVVGMGYVSRKEFLERFDTGIPVGGTNSQTKNNTQVLILYGSEKSLPSSPSTSTSSSFDDAIRNCDTMRVVTTKSRTRDGVNDIRNECVAVMGNGPVDSAHVHSWSRPVATATAAADPAASSGFQYLASHYRPKQMPDAATQQISFHELNNYLSHFEAALLELKPILAAASRDGRRPVTVMVANRGHSDYFVNFVCAARARRVDVTNVVLFATDRETYDLARSMHVLAYYNEPIFGAIPKDEPKAYGSKSYGRIFMSKVYCVHLVNALGHDLLFADLDMTWYQDPVPYFTDRHDDFDIYISYNGHPEVKFKPLQANTGLYFVRCNARTRHFFSLFIRMGDLVLAENSHQAVFVMLANEQASLRGLRVKTFHEDYRMFLTGYEYVFKRKVVDAAVAGEYLPYIFHANFFVSQEKQNKLIETKNWYIRNDNGSNNQTTTQCSMITKLTEPIVDPITTCCLSEPATMSQHPVDSR